MASIEVQGLDSVLKRLDPAKAERITDKTIDTIGKRFENETANLLQSSIASNPPSPRYRRTGKSVRGREFTRQGKTQGKVSFASTKAGANREYTKYLNRNSRIKKLNFKFFDKKVEEFKSKRAGEILQETFKSMFK